MSTPRVPVLDRLTRRIDITESGCWEWKGARTRNGYGKIGVDGRFLSVHRVAYELLVGPIPSHLVIDHLCRNRACFHPDHLEAVTRSENVLRGVSPGLSSARLAAQAAARTACPSGHPYDDANTYITAEGWRVCRACGRESALRRYYRTRGNA